METDTQLGAADDTAYYEAERTAYISIFEFIRTDLLQNPRVIKMTDLTIKLISFMTLAGITFIHKSRRKHIRCLETEFKDLLQIFPEARCTHLSFYVYLNSLKCNISMSKRLIALNCLHTLSNQAIKGKY